MVKETSATVTTVTTTTTAITANITTIPMTESCCLSSPILKKCHEPLSNLANTCSLRERLLELLQQQQQQQAGRESATAQPLQREEEATPVDKDGYDDDLLQDIALIEALLSPMLKLNPKLRARPQAVLESQLWLFQ
mmetsp:Transcript_42043/g.62829  ORF Transcript_42043/g.62829 Transcript_42043/m.62829 type:complete len:137 (+) Transcript_42043:3-413(+)